MDCKSRRNINGYPKRKNPRTALAGNRMAMGLYPKYMDLFMLPSPAAW